MSVEHWCNDNHRRKPKYSEESCSTTTNSMRTGLGLNPGLRDERLATDRPNYGTANKGEVSSCVIGVGNNPLKRLCNFYQTARRHMKRQQTVRSSDLKV